MLLEDLNQSLDTQHLSLGVMDLEGTVAKHQEAVPVLELSRLLLVGGVLHDAKWHTR